MTKKVILWVIVIVFAVGFLAQLGYGIYTKKAAQGKLEQDGYALFVTERAAFEQLYDAVLEIQNNPSPENYTAAFQLAADTDMTCRLSYLSLQGDYDSSGAAMMFYANFFYQVRMITADAQTPEALDFLVSSMEAVLEVYDECAASNDIRAFYTKINGIYNDIYLKVFQYWEYPQIVH